MSFFVIGLSCGGETCVGEWYGLFSTFRGVPRRLRLLFHLPFPLLSEDDDCVDGDDGDDGDTRFAAYSCPSLVSTGVLGASCT